MDRRKFLKGLAAVPVVAALPAVGDGVMLQSMPHPRTGPPLPPAFYGESIASSAAVRQANIALNKIYNNLITPEQLCRESLEMLEVEINNP